MMTFSGKTYRHKFLSEYPGAIVLIARQNIEIALSIRVRPSFACCIDGIDVHRSGTNFDATHNLQCKATCQSK